MNNDIKEIIKISDKLDDAVRKGFEKGKKENRKKRLFNRGIAAAVIILGITSSYMVRAVSEVGNIFEYFNDGIYKENSEGYKEIGNEIDMIVQDNGVEVTLDKIIVDDNVLLASLIVKSDKLIGYDEINKPQDFINEELYISINGESPSYYKTNVTIVDEETAAIVLESNVSNINLDDEVNVNLSIGKFTRGKKTIAKGNWDFNVKIKKGDEINEYDVNKSLRLSDIYTNVNIQKLVITPLENKLYVNGKADNDSDFILNENSFIVRDNNKTILLTDFSQGSSDYDGNYEYTFNILNDLSNIRYIEIIKKSGNEVVRTDEGGYILECSHSKKGDPIRKTISRKPTKKELSDGYALDEVVYNIDIDENTAFENIDNLIGKEIEINSANRVIIKDIKIYDNYTEIVMKINGYYDYKLLDFMVLFDENMNDVCRYEGGVVTLNDITEKVVTVRLNRLDPSKKYTVGIPKVTDLTLDETEKVTINLK